MRWYILFLFQTSACHHRGRREDVLEGFLKDLKGIKIFIAIEFASDKRKIKIKMANSKKQHAYISVKIS